MDDTPAPTEEPDQLRVGRALLICASFVATQLSTGVLVVLALMAWRGVGGANLQEPAVIAELQRSAAPIANVLGMAFGGVVVVLMTWRAARGRICGRSVRGIGWSPGRLVHLGVGLCSGLLLGFGLIVANAVLGPTEIEVSGPLVEMAQTPGWPRLAWAILAVLIAPLVEEFLFRGVLFAGVARSWGRPLAAGVVTVCFIALHAPQIWSYWPALASITLFAMGAITLRLATQAVGPAVAMHVGYNGALVLTVFAASSLEVV